MSKLGVGVGEEFPVEDARPNEPPPPPADDEERRRRWRRFRFFHFLAHLALIGLVVAGIVWLFRPRTYLYPDPYLLPYGFYPYPHHFFFPFFPVLFVVLLLALFWRRRGCHVRYRHWHGPRERRGEEV